MGVQMNRIDIHFLLLAAVSLVIGVSIGVYMAASHDFQLMPIHAHLNLVGWASLALFVLVYRAYPVLAQRRLAAIHLGLAAPAAVLLPIGIALALFTGFPWLAMISALLWLAGCVLFLIQLAGLALAGRSLAAPLPAE